MRLWKEEEEGGGGWTLQMYSPFTECIHRFGHFINGYHSLSLMLLSFMDGDCGKQISGGGGGG